MIHVVLENGVLALPGVTDRPLNALRLPIAYIEVEAHVVTLGSVIKDMEQRMMKRFNNFTKTLGRKFSAQITSHCKASTLRYPI